MKRHATIAMALGILVLSALTATAQAQEDPAIAHAQRVFESIRAGKFADVVKEFVPRMAEAIAPERLSQLWLSLTGQVGAFDSIIDKQTTTMNGMKVVTLGTKFEKAMINTVIVFDADDKIAGLNFTPRPN